MPNALAEETSPYLRQHAGNPVDWLPWGQQAFERARELERPLLVSIGYSACHWCHVMERESFEDPSVAAIMNEGFVCVKVDREERPDVDALYMEAVQGMTGHGGWPLNVFLTPEGLPFYGGTYFPPDERPGMPSFSQVLLAISETWEQRSEEIRSSSEQLRERLSGGALLKPSRNSFDQGTLEDAVARLRESFDSVNGGFGSAPKFPQASTVEFLLCRAANADTDSPALRMARSTLGSMAGGGIYDQIGGGFHRYAVDASWTVPHFEKMLYDNALLARAYLHGAQLTDDPRMLEVCRETLDWMLREMRAPEGGFYSALDADSEGVEGRYYVWSVPELRSLLGDDAEEAIRWLGASEQGNFDEAGRDRFSTPGLNVLEDRGPRPTPERAARIRERLLKARDMRVRPGLDDKRLTSWNALAIVALAECGAHLAGSESQEERESGHLYLDAAGACAEFVLERLRTADGRVLRTFNEGQAKLDGYLEDYAFLLEALLALFEATCREQWLQCAREVADELIARFADEGSGGFFSTASDGEALIARRKELEDAPIPSGGSSAALGLLRLAQLTGEQRFQDGSSGAIRLVQEIAPRHPAAFGHMLQAMHWSLAPMRPIACELPQAAS